MSDPAFVAVQKSLHVEPVIVVRSLRKNPHGGRDVKLMDLGGNVVRVIKNVPGLGCLLSTSQDGLICSYSTVEEGALVIDPATGR